MPVIDHCQQPILLTIIAQKMVNLKNADDSHNANPIQLGSSCLEKMTLCMNVFTREEISVPQTH